MSPISADHRRTFAWGACASPNRPASSGEAWFDTADFADARSFVALWDTVLIGTGVCGGNFPEVADRERFVRIRTVDWAGNPAEWVEYEGGAVRVGGSSALGGSVWMVLFALPALLRRRRPRD